MTDSSRLAVSLFSGAGIGDVGLRAGGLEYVVMSELDPPRADVAARNFPSAKMVVGDIWGIKDQIIDLTEAELRSRSEELFLVSCTAPCQGMSKSGRGTLLRNAKLGRRPKLDPRNRLILPALEVIQRLKPEWVVFENVSEMAQTLIEDLSGELRPILDIVHDSLSPEYAGAAYDLELADFGIPQRRRRLITVYTRSAEGKQYLASGGDFVPTRTHSAKPRNGQLPWIPVSEILDRFPPLDAREKALASNAELPFHRVPLLDERKYEWVSLTPPGASAFDNQCTECGHSENTTHGNTRQDGVNRSSKETPIRCGNCDALLPRPHVVEDGEPRIMRGFTSAYKRMNGDLPAPALTRNLSYACSDQKLHPHQNRVLSLAEAFAVHTLDEYPFSWSLDGGTETKDGVIRLALGESIPPRFMHLLAEHLCNVADGDTITRLELREVGK